MGCGWGVFMAGWPSSTFVLLNDNFRFRFYDAAQCVSV